MKLLNLKIIRDVRARTYVTDDREPEDQFSIPTGGGDSQDDDGRQSEIKQVPNPTNASPDTSPLNITDGTINFFDGNDLYTNSSRLYTKYFDKSIYLNYETIYR